jgi:Big-like domain-containing protein
MQPFRMVAAAGAVAALAVAGCERGPTAPGAAAAIRISAPVAGTAIDQLVVTVTASDIATPLVFNIPIANQVAQGTIHIPPGAARTIDVQAFDALGSVIFEGSKTIDVRPGQNPPVSIPLVAKAGQVTIIVTLGPVSVVVQPTSVSLPASGTVQLSATVTAADGEVLPGAVEWATTDPALATVDQSGLVSALRSGAVDIVATAAGVAGVSRIGVISSSAPTVWGPEPGAPRVSDLGYLWASATNDVAVAVAHGDSVARWDGAAWIPVYLRNGAQALYHMWGVSRASVYLVTQAGVTPSGIQLLHFDGAAWSVLSDAPNLALYGVWAASDDAVFAVGSSAGLATVVEFAGSTPVTVFAGNSLSSLRAVWGASGSDVFAVGSAGVIVHWNGSGWSTMASGTHADLFDVWGTGPSNVYASGAGGTILHFDGSAWSAMASGTTIHLAGISGTGPDNVVVVGGAGTILHFDGVQWRAMASGTSADLVGVWAFSPTDFLVTGANGTMLRSQ